MKIGVTFHTHTKGRYDRFGDYRYQKIKAFGYDCIDFNISNPGTRFYTSTHEESKKLILEEKKMINDAGLTVSQVHGPSFWPPACETELDYTARMDKIKYSMEMTELLDCQKWVIHPITQYGDNDIENGNAQKTWDLNIKLMSELLENAIKHNITICLENSTMAGFSIARYDKTLKFVQAMNSDNFKICLDTGHTTAFSQDSIGDIVRALGSYIHALHIHDNVYGRDMHLVPCCGVINWDEFAKALADINFNGVLSFESRINEMLDDDLFSDMSIMQAKIARKIADKIEACKNTSLDTSSK